MKIITCVAVVTLSVLGPQDPIPDQENRCCIPNQIIESPLCSSTCVAAPTCTNQQVAQFVVIDASCSSQNTGTCRREWKKVITLLGTCTVVVCDTPAGTSKCLWTSNGTSVTTPYMFCSETSTKCKG